jgi:transcription factor SFP1
MDMEDSQRTMQQTRQLFGQQQRPQLHLNSSGLPHQALRTSQPATPAAASFGFQNNPTVSSVNTPTLATQQGLPQRQSQFLQDKSADDMDDELPGMPMQMNLGNMNLNGSQFGLGIGNGVGGLSLDTIDEPAKRLFSPGGNAAGMNQRRLIEQQLAQLSNLDQGQFPTGADPNLLLQQVTSAYMMQEEHKPFKCPVIGCEKAYKNQNGLKYVGYS